MDIKLEATEESTYPNITSAKREFIEKVGQFYEQYGLTRIGGRMLGLIMVASAPMSIQQMGETLQVSRSSISTNLRMLAFIGLIEQVALPGTVRDFYQLAPRAWERILEAEVKGLVALQALTTGVLGSMRPEDPAWAPLNELREGMAMLNTMYGELIEKWKSAQETRQNRLIHEITRQ